MVNGVNLIDMKRFKIFLSMLVIIYSCNPRENNELLIIDIAKSSETELSISDLAEGITYIPLQSEFLFKNPFSIIATKENFILSTYPSNILAFTRNGKFINEIGKVGKGPGEYLFPKHLTYDQSEGLLYIYDNKRILQYDLSGKFRNEINLEKFSSDFHDIHLYNGDLYLAGGTYFGNAIYDWIAVDSSLNIQSYKLNHNGSFGAMGDGTTIREGRGGFFSYSDDIYFWNGFNDTVYSITQNSYRPAILFEAGEFRHPHTPILFEDRSKYFFINYLFGSKDFIFLVYTLNNYQYTSLFDKNNRKLQTINKSSTVSVFNIPGIPNDLDGGPEFPPYYYFQENGEEFLIGWIHAFRIKAHVEKEAFKNSIPKYPEKKKELEKLAASLDENDNPVLMIVRLKD
jgi:hypothetical protein